MKGAGAARGDTCAWAAPQCWLGAEKDSGSLPSHPDPLCFRRWQPSAPTAALKQGPRLRSLSVLLRRVTPPPVHTQSLPSCRPDEADGRGLDQSEEGNGAPRAGRGKAADQDAGVRPCAPSCVPGARHSATQKLARESGAMISAQREILSDSCRAPWVPGQL